MTRLVHLPLKSRLVPAIAGLVLLGGVGAAHAQERGRPGAAVVPYLALGPVFDHGDWVSGLAGVGAQLEQRLGSRWRAEAHVGYRVVGAVCADEVRGCDTDGFETGIALLHVLGPVSLGGALGLIHVDGLHMSAGARVGADLSRHVRAEPRAERLLRGGAVYLPVALGWRIPLPERE